MKPRKALAPSSERDNNFNLLRMAAATAVLVSHAYPLSLGEGAAEPLQHVLGMDLGRLAVYSFFAISGYFVSQSFERNPNIIDFSVARVFRIYPALLCALVLTVVALGPAFTTLRLPEYLASTEVFSYIPANLSLVRLQYELPGVFEKNPYPGAINGSLWTLVYEAGCYALVASVGIWGMMTNRRCFVFFLIGYGAFYAALPLLHVQSERLVEIHELTFPFTLGMVLFHFRDRIRFRFDVCCILFLIAFLVRGHPGFENIFIVSWCYGLFYVGFARVPMLSRYNLLGDYSYGTYVYAFPVEQIVVTCLPNSDPAVLMAWGFPITLGLAALSWHFIERPAIARRGLAANFVKHRRWDREAAAQGVARNPRS